jgi:FtsP/CotA-like multicopper oxidase with cupredoxin domain
MARGVSAKNVPDMPDPGPGAMTYYFPNGESSRLMFYHDHTIGLTRLNVYAGVAAGYLLNDNAGVGENYPELANLLPTDQIPLVIQDRTFVPKNIAIQDAKWDATTMGQEGDFWYPHVYETNQDPNSFDGTNPVGRWDWGNWFWPVFPSVYDLPTGQVNAVNLTTNLSEVSTTPEAFMDTAMVNGTAYPTLNVEPKAYRFRVLNGSNDRFLNLGLYLAADKNTTDPVNPTNSANTVLCDGISTRPSNQEGTQGVIPSPADCTEVKMVNFDSSYTPPHVAHTADGTIGFPTTGGIAGTGWGAQVSGLFPQGAPDPATAGPSFIQIGNEGGLLANPLEIPSTPLNYEYNKRSVTVLNVLERGLYLGNAERADVLVDFSNYAGKTLILYNDAPAPVPASDPRIDYYTGSGDQTGVGGSANIKPGYGPNTRTIMQIVVAQSATGTVKTVNVPALQAALPKAYATTQAKPIVPEPEYNQAFAADPAYTAVAPTARYNARIYTGAVYLNAFQGVKFNTPEAMTYLPSPVCTTTANCSTARAAQLAQPNKGLVTVAAGTAVNAYVESKAIQELFDPAYGRMNATLGVELPFTSALTQTTIPLGYVDPTTETVADGETQFWKITHNGVDTHPVHFHLVNVEVINRIGWDGTIKQPYGDEIGWKETVKMNPLEDIVVAVRAKKPTLQGVADANGLPVASNAFGLPTSSRLMDPSQAIGSAIGFTQIDPITGNPAVKTNQIADYGWEYVWHCHILGHEENDFMRPVVFNAKELAPAAPTNAAINGNVLTWADNAKTEYAYKVESAPLTNGVVGTYTDLSTTVLPADQKIGAAPLANANTFTDTTVLTPNTDYRYRITAIGAAGNASTTVDLATAPSAPVLATPTAITTTGLTLTWTQASTNANGGFQVWQVGQVAPIATLAKTVKTYNVTGLTAGTAYQFYVVAINGALTTQSNTVSTTTVAASIVAAPTNLVIQRTSATAAAISWTDTASNEKSFQVQTSINGGTTWTNLGAVMNRTAAQATSVGTTVNGNAITVSATTNAVYRVNVTSTTNATASSASVALNNAVAPSAPTGLSATKVSGRTAAVVTLTWTDTANNNATFALQRSVNGGTTWTTVSTTIGANTTTTTQSITNTPGIITNLYRLQAVNSVGGSAWSNTFTIVTP